MRVWLSPDQADLFDPGPDPVGHQPRRTPKARGGRPRQKFPICDASGKRRLTERAAELHVAAALKLRDRAGGHLPAWNIRRAYLCRHCGDHHTTSKPLWGQK